MIFEYSDLMIGFALSELFLTSNGRSHLEFKEQLSECSVCINFRHCPINPGLLKYFVAGNVPGPIVFGIVFDTACLVWQEKCDGRGSCWIYDTQFLAEGIFWACVIVKLISSAGFFLALVLYRPPPPEQTDDAAMTVDVKPELTGDVISSDEKPGQNDYEEITDKHLHFHNGAFLSEESTHL